MIDYTIRGGSGTGISYYSKLLKCANMAYLDRQEATEEYTIQGNLGIGTLYHALMDLYFSGHEVDPNQVRFLKKDGEEARVDEVARAEATRLFGWYTDRFSRFSFGDVLATELTVTDMLTGSIFGTKADLPFTCGLDLLVQVDEAAKLVIKEERGIELQECGVYVVDFKTERALQMGMTDRYLNSIQMSAYQIVAKEVLGYDVKGALVDVLIKTKEPRNIVVPVAYPSSIERKVLMSFWETVDRRLTYPRECNLDACFFPNVCRHYTSGACLRFEEKSSG